MNNQVSHLGLWLYRLITYINIPLTMLAKVFYIYLGIQLGTDPTGEIRTLLLLIVFFLGLHFKARCFYWFVYIGCAFGIFSYGVSLWSIIENKSNGTPLSFEYVAGILFFLVGLIVILYITIKWSEAKPLFKSKQQKTSEDLQEQKDENIRTENKPPLVISAIIIFNLVGTIITLIWVYANSFQSGATNPHINVKPQPTNTYTQQEPARAPDYFDSIMAQSAQQQQQQVVAQPQQTIPTPPNDDRTKAFHLAVQQHLPEFSKLLADPEFMKYASEKEIDFTGNKAITLIQHAGNTKDISLIPKIRKLVDEYYQIQRSKQPDPMPNVEIGFGCKLTDNRTVMVTKGYNDQYFYTAFGKDPGKIELNFSNGSSQIKTNSLWHKNGVTLVMQNGTYQYRISRQGKNTTIFVYNGDKGIGTYYCQANQTTWNLDVLPFIAVNKGSESHKRYCKQIISDGLYLAKMAKRCPLELSNVNVFVEDTAVFFDAEGCSYLVQGNNAEMQSLVKSLSDKLNASIDKKSQKLGAQFCAKEAGYANKMAERYLEFYSR